MSTFYTLRKQIINTYTDAPKIIVEHFFSKIVFANKFTTYPTNMEAKNLGCSLKNIPIPTKQHYLKSMIDKVESFVTRLRWKAYFFEKPDQRNSNNSTNFGFKSNVTPPQNEKLTSFENGLYDMVRSI